MPKKLILPARMNSHAKPDRVGCEVRGDGRGNILLNFNHPVQHVVYTPNEAAELAKALALAAQDQARHGGDPLKGTGL